MFLRRFYEWREDFETAELAAEAEVAERMYITPHGLAARRVTTVPLFISDARQRRY